MTLQSITIPLKAMGKVRMVSSDRWKIPKGIARKCVYDYLLFADELRLACSGFTLADSFAIRFYFAMPESWSEKKRKEMNGKPHQVKPDIDNSIKSVLDILRPKNDQEICSLMAMKVWSSTSCIVIENRLL